jgi:FkbM family methyltransferase
VAATSHERETQLVAAFFGDIRGYFVEVGANEPRLRSQTWHLEQAGWNGILVEPQPDLVNELRAMRTARVFAVACSGPEDRGRTLPFHVAGPLSSLDRTAMAPGTRPEKVIDVPVRTLDDILEEAQAPVGFDFLSIDVEGHEVEVLRGMSLARWQPRLVMLEDHVADLTSHRLMTSAGYRIIRRYENNGWYVPRSSNVHMAIGDLWEIVRKYYLALPIRKLRNLSRRRRGTIGVAAEAESR